MLLLVTKTSQNVVASVSLGIEVPTALTCGLWIVYIIVFGLISLVRGHNFAETYHGIPPPEFRKTSKPEKGILRMILGPKRVDGPKRVGAHKYLDGAEDIEEKLAIRIEVAEFFWSHSCFRKYP